MSSAVRQAANVMFSEEFARIVATAFKTNPAAALAPALKARLWQSPTFVPTPDLPLADYTAEEADFTDYVEQAITLLEPINMGEQVDGCLATVTFQMTTDPAVITNTIYGYYLVSGTVLVAAERFAENQEVTMAEFGDALVLTIALPVSQRQSVDLV